MREMIVNNGFFIVKSKELQCCVEDAQRFYTEHKGKIEMVGKFKVIVFASSSSVLHPPFIEPCYVIRK